MAGNDSNVVFRPIYLTPVDNILFNWTAINGTLEHHKSDDTWVYIGRIITWSQEGSEDKSSDGIIVLRPFVCKISNINLYTCYVLVLRYIEYYSFV